MPLPWYLHPCSVSAAHREPVDGALCHADDREVDEGEDRPFLNTLASTANLKPPPAEQTTGPFTQRFGVHRPACCGQCLVAEFNADNSLWITVLLLLVPSITWGVFVVPELDQEFGLWPVAVCSAFLLSACVFLILTWLVEPGILPHAELEDRSDPSKPRTLVYAVLHGKYYLRKTFRAQKSRFTNNLIEGFDHYCPYVGNAIGKRNYKYFTIFLTSAFLLCMGVCATSVALVLERSRKQDHKDFWHAVKRSTGATVLAGFSLVMGSSILCLLQYHFRIIAKGATTWEDLKVQFPNGRNPNNLGCRRNCWVVFCSPHHPSRVANLTPTSSATVHLLGAAVGDGSSAAPDILNLNESLLFSPNTPASVRESSPRVGAINGALNVLIVPPTQTPSSKQVTGSDQV